MIFITQKLDATVKKLAKKDCIFEISIKKYVD